MQPPRSPGSFKITERFACEESLRTSLVPMSPIQLRPRNKKPYSAASSHNCTSSASDRTSFIQQTARLCCELMSSPELEVSCELESPCTDLARLLRCPF